MPNAFLSTDNLGPPGPPGPPGTDGPAGADGADGADASADVDYTTFDPAAAKDDLSSAQTGFKGSIETYLAEEQIVNGGFVVRHWHPRQLGEPGPSVRVKRMPSVLPQPHEIIGVALDSAAAVGDPVRVLTKGFGTAKFDTQIAAPPEVRLDATTNGRTYSRPACVFRDSGGEPGDYGNSESFLIIFDAGTTGGVPNTWTIKVNDFSFEHSTVSMYDRLGVQESTNGSLWTNLSVPWMQASATTSPPWSTSFAGSSWNSSSSDEGGLFPSDTTRAILLGMPAQDATITVNSRYLRFWFVSDGSSTRPGWDLTLESSSYTPTPQSVPLDAPLYVDLLDPKRLTENNASGLQVARAGWSNTAEDSIVVRLG